VRQKSPNAIRMAYSDENNRQGLVQLCACGAIHRFLCFPWGKNKIASQLDRDFLTRSRIRAQKCWDYLGKGERLPALPEILKELEYVLGTSTYTAEDIAVVIGQEPAIAAKLLWVVNSSAFARVEKIADLSLAVSFLGVPTVKELLLYLCTVDHFKSPKKCQALVRQVADHSFQCSLLAGKIAGEINPKFENDAASAGLLHDIGKLLLIANSCRELPLNRLHRQWLTPNEEEDLFGFNHIELGSCLMMRWNLPMSLIETTANHNYPLQKLWGITKIVALANRCLHEVHKTAESELDQLADKYPIHTWHQWAEEISRNSSFPVL